MLPGALVAMAALPWMRSPDSGLGLLLSRPPQAGWAGAALDTLKLAGGGCACALLLPGCCPAAWLLPGCCLPSA